MTHIPKAQDLAIKHVPQLHERCRETDSEKARKFVRSRPFDVIPQFQNLQVLPELRAQVEAVIGPLRSVWVAHVDVGVNLGDLGAKIVLHRGLWSGRECLAEWNSHAMTVYSLRKEIMLNSSLSTRHNRSVIADGRSVTVA